MRSEARLPLRLAVFTESIYDVAATAAVAAVAVVVAVDIPVVGTELDNGVGIKSLWAIFTGKAFFAVVGALADVNVDVDVDVLLLFLFFFFLLALFFITSDFIESGRIVP